MTLSLLETVVNKIKPLLIGDEVNVVVSKVKEDGLEVQVQNKNLQAFIPLHHLSVNYDLNSVLLGKFHKVTNVFYCIRLDILLLLSILDIVWKNQVCI